MISTRLPQFLLKSLRMPGIAPPPRQLFAPGIVLLALASMAPSVAAQTSIQTSPAPPAIEPQVSPADAMAKLSFLLGRWQGEGSMRMGPGEPKRTQVTEHAYQKLGGTVLVLEGLGTAEGAPGEAPATVHEAFGVLAWDATTGNYLMRAFRADGQFVDAEVEVGDNRLVWGFVSPRGHVRYTVTLDAEGRWHEIGEFSRDGTAWSGFFEMSLSRTDDG